MSPKLLFAALLSAAVFLALSPSVALGGRMVATGHDPDYHCAYGQDESCNVLFGVVNWVRDGAPDTTRPVLVIDRPPDEAHYSLQTRLGVPSVRVLPGDPISGGLTTAKYSAIVVASEITCGGCDLVGPPDVTAVNSLEADIRAFFNAGGGVVALSGASMSATYYAFTPVPVTGLAVVTDPFALTSFAPLLGLTPASVNCCATHNTFAPNTMMKVAETDAEGRAETVLTAGTVSSGPNGSTILTPPALAPAGLDHFQCYGVTPAKFKQRKVVLRDQFGRKVTRVRAPRQLCNPVHKTVNERTTRVRRPRAHLACHTTLDVAPGVKPRRVGLRNQFVRNQFGSAVETTTGNPEMLCVPSLKRIVKGRALPKGPIPSRVLDHFRCYRVLPSPASRVVRLRDQFADRKAGVIRLVRLCNPVRKRHLGKTTRVRRKTAHLACYSITSPAVWKARHVRVRNQFGLRRLRVERPRTLCLPTFKQILPLVPPVPPPVLGPPLRRPFSIRDVGTSVCFDDRDRVVATLTGATFPVRDGTLTASLIGPSGVAGPAVTARLSEGRFSVSAEPTEGPARYRWSAFVRASDEGSAQTAAAVEVPRDPPRC